MTKLGTDAKAKTIYPGLTPIIRGYPTLNKQEATCPVQRPASLWLLARSGGLWTLQKKT